MEACATGVDDADEAMGPAGLLERGDGDCERDDEAKLEQPELRSRARPSPMANLRSAVKWPGVVLVRASPFAGRVEAGGRDVASGLVCKRRGLDAGWSGPVWLTAVATPRGGADGEADGAAAGYRREEREVRRALAEQPVR